MKQWFAGSLMLTLLALPLAAHAGNVSVVGGTNGPLCGSGGYFSPSQVTVASGDTITFSVPANDPYSGGLQIHGFPEGNFTVLPGSSHTTAALTAGVSYYGTWPSSGCMKGSGSVTASAPATPVPTRSAPTTTTTPAKTPITAAAPSPAASASPSSTVSPPASPRPSTSPSPSQEQAAAATRKSGPSLFLAASTGALGIGVIIAVVVLSLWAKRRLGKPPGGPDVL